MLLFEHKKDLKGHILFKGHLLCKIHFNMAFEHKCVLAVCVNHPILIKSPKCFFFKSP